MSRPSTMQKALNLEEIPRHKWTRMLLRTAVGLLFVAMAGFGGGKWGWPWQPVWAAGVLGGSIWAGQIVHGTLMKLVEPLGALLKIWREK